MSWTFTTTASLLIFAATYVLISLQKIRFLNLDRPSAALGGAVLMVACGVLTLRQGVAAISADTLLLLLGMMVLVAQLKLAGFFEWVSAWILLRARTPERLLWLVVLSSGLLSALFVNDTVCLLFTPVLLDAVLRAKLNPAPYLIALVTGANIGSAMTLTGNPQNMLVGIFSGLPYGRFLLVMLPVAAVGLLIDGLLLRWLYRGRLGRDFSIEGLELPRIDRSEMKRLAAISAIVLAGFLLPFGSWLPRTPAGAAPLGPGQALPFSALVGALLAILLGRRAPARTLAQVDWSLLLFFGALFVVVEGVNSTGLLAAAFEGLRPAFGGEAPSQALVMTGFSVIMSNVVSNVPFVMVTRQWMGGFAEPDLMWYVVAMSSTFAGNLTIVGSVANMIVLELSKDRARIGFREYLRAGIPITLATTAAGIVLILGMYGMDLI